MYDIREDHKISFALKHVQTWVWSIWCVGAPAAQLWMGVTHTFLRHQHKLWFCAGINFFGALGGWEGEEAGSEKDVL